MPTVLPDLLPTLAALVPGVNIPIWNEYVRLLEGILGFLANATGNLGIAIIIFTIGVKTLLLPLTVQATRSSKAMQELQPKIKELQKKHAKDRQRLTQETMALYSQYHVNPMAGCLPMLLQIPIFLGVYQSILNLSQGSAAASYAKSFLWVPNLAQPDPIHLLPILAAAFQFVQTKMMRPANQGKITDPQQAMMNQLMNFMPLSVILFGWNFAAGPVLYWVAQSIYSVAQQWIITGWGSMLEWAPWLPELPEHKRLGYRPPRNLDDVVVLGGDGGATVKAGGIQGWFQAQMEKAQAAQLEATQAPAAKAAEESAPAARNGSGGKNSGSNSGKAQVVQRGSKSAPADGGDGDGDGDSDSDSNNGTASESRQGKAVIVPRKARSKGTGAN
jgi:YidC/Oxa1 family membrane protein insertase